MRIAAFLIARRTMHPEHDEHHMKNPTIRLDQRMMRELVIVVRVSKVFRWRLRLAMLLMRIAGRLGGFRQIKLVRERPPGPINT